MSIELNRTLIQTQLFILITFSYTTNSL